jgi:hypothetical protein
MGTPAYYTPSLWTEESILADGRNLVELIERTALVFNAEGKCVSQHQFTARLPEEIRVIGSL